MSSGLAPHFALLVDELAAVEAAPLSVRRALLCASLIDVFADRVFAAAGGDEDVLAFRARMAAACPALGLIAAVCAQRPDGPRLEIRTVTVPVADYPALGVEDYMVSLYNENSVQCLFLGDRPALEVLQEAVAFWSAFRDEDRSARVSA